MPLCEKCGKVESKHKCLMCHRYTCDGCSELPGNINESVRYYKERKCYK